MNYHDDSPIESDADDVLGFNSLADKIANQIQALGDNAAKHAVAISIEGPWGSGKTSLVNLVADAMNRVPKRYAVSRFNAWNYQRGEDLVEGFVSTLRAILTSTEVEKVRKELTRLADNYFDTFRPRAANTKALHLAFKTLRQSPESAKGALAKKMANGTEKILIIIDDLDRLPDEQILAVIRLVASSLNLPHVVYLLVFESSAVEEALSKSYSQGGMGYLDKIIQLRFQMPVLSSSRLWELLLHEASALAVQYRVPLLGANNIDAYHIMEAGRNLVLTLRSAKNVLRLFEEKLIVLGREILAEEVLALCVIESSDPSLFRWIQANYIQLLGYKGDFDEMTSLEARIKRSESAFNSIPSKHDESVLHLLKLLFSPNPQMPTEVVRVHRIRELDRAHAFFRKTRSGIPVLVEDVEELTETFYPNEMERVIQKHIDRGTLQAFLREITVRGVLDGSIGRESLVEALIVMQGKADAALHTFLGIDDAHFISFIVLDTLDRIDQSVRYELLKSVLDRRAPECLPGMGCLLYRIAQAFAEIGDGVPEERGRLIAREQFDLLRELFLGHMQEGCESVIKSACPNWALSIWKRYREGDYVRRLSSLFASDKSLLVKFATNRLGTVIGEDGRGWGYRGNETELYSDDSLLNALEEVGNMSFARGDYPEKGLVALYLALNGWGVADPDIGQLVSEGLVDRFLGLAKG